MSALGSTHASEAAARNVIAKIDALHGYPKWEQGEIGPPVWTQTHTQPIELTDGTWLVQMNESIRSRIPSPPAQLRTIARERIKERPDADMPAQAQGGRP
jgi:hypothetical protein